MTKLFVSEQNSDFPLHLWNILTFYKKLCFSRTKKKQKTGNCLRLRKVPCKLQVIDRFQISSQTQHLRQPQLKLLQILICNLRILERNISRVNCHNFPKLDMLKPLNHRNILCKLQLVTSKNIR